MGVPYESVGRPVAIDGLVRLARPLPTVTEGRLETQIVHVMIYGNVTFAGTTLDLTNALGPLTAGRPLRLSFATDPAGRRGHDLGSHVRQRPGRGVGADGGLGGAPVAGRQPGGCRPAARPRGRPAGDDHRPVTVPLVEIDGLTFRYRRATEPAIRDISLTIQPGEVLLVAGPSGCGKSTLIRSINGLIPHAYPGELSGAVRIDGRPTTDLRLREISRTIGTMLQDPAKQIVGATVEAELAFGPENLGLDRAEIAERIRTVVDRTGIQGLAGRETAALSGGERQLVAAAGILMMQPRLYVVDEPLANLDPATAARLLALLRALADEGNAVLIVEHRVEEALELPPGPGPLSRRRPDPLPGLHRRLPRNRRSGGRQAPVRGRARAGPSRLDVIGRWRGRSPAEAGKPGRLRARRGWGGSPPRVPRRPGRLRHA